MAKKAQKTKPVEQHIETPAVPNTVDSGNGRRVEPIVLNTKQETEYKALTTKSAKIRYLHAEKFSRGQIALFMGIKYQHVRNVLITPLKKPVESPATN